jgi:hypothetical protein
MSKWNLLSGLVNSNKRDPNHNASIHRFVGHSSFVKKKQIWRGFILYLRLSEFSSNDGCSKIIVKACEEYIEKVDCAEVRVHIIANPSNQIELGLQSSLRTSLLATASDHLAFNFITEVDDGTNTALTHEYQLVNSLYQPFCKQSSYYRYDLAPLSDCCLYTREPPEKKRITSSEILSNQIYGVDNTGNICVWPSEPLLLYVILENNELRKTVEGRSILEIGGGSSSLVGLGLAAAGVSSKVLLTDGHPVCVQNQVKFLISADPCDSLTYHLFLSFLREFVWKCVNQ